VVSLAHRLHADHLQVTLPTSLSALQAEVIDDAYRWTLDYQIVESSIIPGVSRHTLGEFNFITGTDSGSAGYRDMGITHVCNQETIALGRFLPSVT